jgi:hypothetical protein
MTVDARTRKIRGVVMQIRGECVPPNCLPVGISVDEDFGYFVVNAGAGLELQAYIDRLVEVAGSVTELNGLTGKNRWAVEVSGYTVQP